MLNLLWLIPTLPFLGFFLIVSGGRRLSGRGGAAIGIGSIALSFIASLAVGFDFLINPPAAHSYSQTLWTWMQVGNFRPEIGFYLDALSLIMVLVVTFVGLLIHIYSAEFMEEDEGYGRFFAYMNLFVGSMLTLVLAKNLLLLYLGWEGVGLCSYLLIGFWYKDPVNGLAARKAFVVTRIGDTAFSIGLFLLFTELGTLEIQPLLQRATEQWPAGNGLAIAAAALLLGGAVGKSAQLPLQTWLPDAMAGPTPVSALIHAATMVTAGVYLIARTHVLFSLAPPVQAAVAIIGAATLLLAGFSALTQSDIKRVLAYSTISQIGYMFLALGVGAWSAAMFHFMTHAFFKALLFLAAGVVIEALRHEHNIFRMGGLRKHLPVAFWTFLIGAASLSAVPLVTAGFYSKDLILSQAWSSPSGSPWLWAAGLAGAFLTSLYTFRMVFVTFFGEPNSIVGKRPGPLMLAPLVILAFFSIFGGFVEIPATLGDKPFFSGFMNTALPPAIPGPGAEKIEPVLQAIAGITSVAGIFAAYVFFLLRPKYARAAASSRAGSAVHQFWYSGWGFDRFYDTLFVRPFVWIATTNQNDFVDLLSIATARLSRSMNHVLAVTQTGRVRSYALGIALGAIIAIAIAVWT